MIRTKPAAVAGMNDCCIDALNEFDDSAAKPWDAFRCPECATCVVLEQFGVWRVSGRGAARRQREQPVTETETTNASM